jgi:hypothetical protein
LHKTKKESGNPDDIHKEKVTHKEKVPYSLELGLANYNPKTKSNQPFNFAQPVN